MGYSFHPKVWEVLNQRIPKKLKANYREEGEFLIVLSLCFLGKGMISLNRTAATIYQLCDGTHTIGDIIQHLHQEYPEVPEENLIVDVHQCIRNLEHKRLVTVVNQKYLKDAALYLNS